MFKTETKAVAVVALAVIELRGQPLAAAALPKAN
jgi:hypothetical protein